MSSDREWIHEIIDSGELPTGIGHEGDSDSDELERYRLSLALLESSGKNAPPGFEASVMARIDNVRRRSSWASRLRSFWPGEGRWVLPSLSGGLAALMIVFSFNLLGGFGEVKPVPSEGGGMVEVMFEVHAPEARRVELVGSFNEWRKGEILLDGPDASGHWVASVELPRGHYEYFFLVNGSELMTDPMAAAFRPDGFGRENAIIEL
ncbi:MAG: hypothetical protein C0609_06370 [Deltaproteobacteria bacterium]|nr:MAG: hypothetical protein C0609_06370 [Deltaproteobacteria bacterium]